MHINLLGPVEVVTDHGQVELGAPKPRAMLALEAGSTVSAEHLIDGLWGDAPPATANKLVQLYVSQLRKAMAPFGENGLITTHGAGYELRVGRDHVDAARFERLLAQGAAREALRLWRGAALADVAKEPFAAPEIRRVEELHTAALEPLRERLHAQRMLALYRSGRQAEALEAYRQARAALVEEIGVEPGPDLRRLHDAILHQDPSLDAPEEPVDRPGTPLLGRDAELGRLWQLWPRTTEGGGASVLVTGGRGIGKTRLALEFAHDVRRDRGEVVWCDGAGNQAAALRKAAGAPQPTLLVLDDLGEEVCEPLDRLREAPVLVLMTTARAVGIPADESLTLAPLPPDAAAALARFHVGARDGDELPVERIVAESGGVPALVRDAALEWTRTQAMRRLGDAATHTSAGRAGWRGGGGGPGGGGL